MSQRQTILLQAPKPLTIFISKFNIHLNVKEFCLSIKLSGQVYRYIYLIYISINLYLIYIMLYIYINIYIFSHFFMLW